MAITAPRWTPHRLAHKESAAPFEQPRFITSRMQVLRAGYFVHVRLTEPAAEEPRNNGSSGSMRSGGPPNVITTGSAVIAASRSGTWARESGLFLRYQASGLSAAALSCIVTCPRPGVSN